ncbi:major facilitator superfamily domain-containing protein [Daedaleopsis nitida]|nr:major facilitator superfamily domain-containing protein [Daedaleopsis nitida]
MAAFKDPMGDVEGRGVKTVEVHDIYENEAHAVDPVYQAKARILNAAFQDIGTGKYQWFLFCVGGFGWFADNAWQCLTGLITNFVVNEFPNFKGPFPIFAQTIGLVVCAVLWGVGCDFWGRKWSFNLTLLINTVFALAAGGSPNPVALCVLISTWNLGVGGNLPVDSAVFKFLEFVPGSHRCQLLTVLSIWWAIGWRYLMWMLGGIMMALFILRFFVFQMYEFPKYLMGRGRDAEAVEIACSTSLLATLWALIGLASPLYNGFVTVFAETCVTSSTIPYSDMITAYLVTQQVILRIMGIPGALLARWMVERRHLGRKGTLAISTGASDSSHSALTGVFLFASTTARTSDAILGWNCGYTFTNNVMFGTLYALSPEIFPAKDRGTGNTLVAAANRIFGVLAPVIALYADLAPAVPIYVSVALFLVAGFIALLLPF